MTGVEIIEASPNESGIVSELVFALLRELEPGAEGEISEMDLPSITGELLSRGKIIAFIARSGEENIGVITLHECAAIYAGGLFGEISELYVAPAHRSRDVGGRLVKAALLRGRELGWKRLEVGTPPPGEWPKTTNFYLRNHFKATGARLRRLIP